MLIRSEAEMLEFGEKFAAQLRPPVTLELIGDVGAGKTTFVRGLAKGLGIDEPITSPSFTISRSYAGKVFRLNHYDFYRLNDPGLMADDLNESILDNETVTVVEWGKNLAGLLPYDRRIITITAVSQNARELTIK